MSSEQPVNFHPDGTLFIVSGPSGAGKTTLINRVRERLAPVGIVLHFSVSHTTRRPRTSEVDGVHYHFVSDGEFDRMVGAGEFLEWAHVHSQRYGTSNREVQTRLDRGEDVILDIDVQGASLIAGSPLRTHSLGVFVFPPSFEELEARLRDRGLNSDDEIRIRMNKALDEIERGFNGYDYVIINNDLEVATSCLEAAIVARKLRSKSALETLRMMAVRFREERNGKTDRHN